MSREGQPLSDVSQPSSPGTYDPSSRSGYPLSAQVIILGWSLWLLASWLVSVSLPVPTSPGRWTVLSAGFALMLVWPAVRLSQARPGHTDPLGPTARVILAEWVALVGIFQAVIWPLTVVAGWSWQQGIWLNAAVASWSLLIGAFILLGLRSPAPLGRWVGMALCALLLVAEPVLLALAGRWGLSAWTLQFSPIEAVWSLSAERRAFYLGDWPWRVGSVAAAAAMLWTVLLAWFARR